MDVSIIIPTRDGATRLAPTVDAVLRSMQASGLRCELIVLDNGATGATAALVEATWPHEVRCVSTDVTGTSNARNLGVHCASATTILFVDDDVTVPLNWVGALAAPLCRGDVDVVAGAIQLAPDLIRSGMTDYHRQLLADTGGGLGDPPERVHGASMGASRRVFDAGVWFHPELGPGRSGFMEEQTWLVAATERRFRATWVSSAPAVHHPEAERLDRAAWLSRAQRQGRSEGLARALYSTDPIRARDLIRIVWASLRRAATVLGDLGSPIPSEARLRALANAHHAIGFVNARRTRPVRFVAEALHRMGCEAASLTRTEPVQAPSKSR